METRILKYPKCKQFKVNFTVLIFLFFCISVSWMRDRFSLNFLIFISQRVLLKIHKDQDSLNHHKIPKWAKRKAKQPPVPPLISLLIGKRQKMVLDLMHLLDQSPPLLSTPPIFNLNLPKLSNLIKLKLWNILNYL